MKGGLANLYVTGIKLHWREEIAIAPGFVMPSLDNRDLCCMSSFDKLCSRKYHLTQTACCKKIEYVELGKTQTVSMCFLCSIDVAEYVS